MASKITQKVMAGMTAVGSLIASFFLTPPRFVWGACGLVIAATGVGLLLHSRWVQSQPNQWLLIIRNGQLYRAGVGLKTFVGFSDTVVRFPTKIEKVSFTANNVTKQKQGVVITGFAFWSVYRDDDGPFRCYKYMEGGGANDNIQAMCESALRNLIANSTLNDVMTNRNHLRDSMKLDLKDQFKGWGVWLESVQITEVTICSQKVFKDLQAEFRQEARLKAEQIEITSNEKMNEARQMSQLKTSTMNENNATSKQITRNNEELKRKKQQADFENAKNQLEIQKLKREKDFELERLKAEFQKETERLNNSQKIKQLEQKYALEYVAKTIDVDRLHDEKTMQKYQIDSMERIYSKLGVKEIKINQFVGDSKSSLANILPSMGFAMGQLQAGN